MKRLNDLQHLQNLFGPDVGRKRQLVHAGLKIAVIINVPDDHLADLTLFFAQIGQPDLLEQILLKRGAGHQRIEHELTFLLVFLALAHR